jgi:hypothetical protein
VEPNRAQGSARSRCIEQFPLLFQRQLAASGYGVVALLFALAYRRLMLLLAGASNVVGDDRSEDEEQKPRWKVMKNKGLVNSI